MSKGLAETSAETTPAPTMYEEREQTENVARGHVEVVEIIGYEATKEPRRHPPERDGVKGAVRKDKEGNILYVEISRGPYFCQTPEQEQIFKENNPKLRTESFTVQLLKSTAIKYLDSPRNMKQFVRKEAQDA